MTGPLTGTRIIEIAGIGPGPFAAMMLADMGAEVVRIDRAQQVARPGARAPERDVMLRGRRNAVIDLKHPDGVATVLDLVEHADGLIEGFRPGVMERLGLGPQQCHERNPKLVYGRMTGWGQDGPYATTAGHDINYIALAGALAHFGVEGGAPVPPLNTVGDFGGGGMFLAFGMVCALYEAARSGTGQVVDAAMVDGAAVLMTMFWGLRGSPLFDEDRRGVNILDTGAPYYNVYRCADGEYVSIGSIEPQFYAELLRLTGLADDPSLASQLDRDLWADAKDRLAAVFSTRTRDEWCALMEGTDVCFAPVLTMADAAKHQHNVERGTFTEVNGIAQPAPAPRFTRTPASIDRPPARPGEHTRDVLEDWGVARTRVDELLSNGAAMQL